MYTLQIIYKFGKHIDLNDVLQYIKRIIKKIQ